MYEQGIGGMRYSVSDTAEYGDLSRGPRVIDDGVRATMAADPVGDPERPVRRGVGGRGSRWPGELLPPRGSRGSASTASRQVGADLRAMMPWISAGKVSVQEASGGQG